MKALQNIHYHSIQASSTLTVILSALFAKHNFMASVTFNTIDILVIPTLLENKYYIIFHFFLSFFFFIYFFYLFYQERFFPK